MLTRQKINASVSPKGSLETLSQREVQQLRETGSGSVYALFRQCALAILNTGSHSDNAKTILEAYPDFEVKIHQQDRGIRLELINAPADAFVDGEPRLVVEQIGVGLCRLRRGVGDQGDGSAGLFPDRDGFRRQSSGRNHLCPARRSFVLGWIRAQSLML